MHRDVKSSALPQKHKKQIYTAKPTPLQTSGFIYYGGFLHAQQDYNDRCDSSALKCMVPSSMTVVFNKMFIICLKLVITSVQHPLEWSKFKKG